jgi:NADPH-dependent curcumin reductase CurA
MLNRSIKLIKRPAGEVKDSDFEWQQEELPALEANQVLLQNLYIALDPALRNWMDDDPNSYIPPVALGSVMSASCLSRVVESRHPDFAVGTITRGLGGWAEYSIVGSGGARQVPGLEIIDPEAGLPLSNYLSHCGTTGLTAYFGLFEVGQPKTDETVLISGAAGAVGSIVGQLAKNKAGCRVVGIAGSAEKCAWLKDIGFDAVINYRECGDMEQAIRQACPDGIDLFFDNVGGEILDAALMNLNFKARVLMCGTISNYNDDLDQRPGPRNMWQLLVKNARIEGFTVGYYGDRWPKATKALATMTLNGELTGKEHIVQGLDELLPAFRGLFHGENKGRLLVELSAQ